MTAEGREPSHRGDEQEPSQTGRTPSPEVAVFGGTAGSAGLACDCGEEFLSTGGQWGDAPSDRPKMPLRDLAALLAAHVCAVPR